MFLNNLALRGQAIPPFCTKDYNFCSSYFPAHQIASEKKGSSLKGMNLLPEGANSFFLEESPFQKGCKTILTVAAFESVSLPLKVKL